MLGNVVLWLDRVGPMIFWTCVITLVTLDAFAVAAVVGAKSRELVNKWTGPVLIANAVLLGVGGGVPAAMYVTKVAVQMIAPSAQATSLSAQASDR